MATTPTEVVQVLDITDEALRKVGDEYAPHALALQKEVALVKIEDNQTFERIAKVGLDAASNIKALEAILEPLKKKRYAAWKRVTDVLAEKTAPFQEIKTKAGKLCAEYAREQERLRLQKEDEERQRLQKEAESNQAAQAEQLATEGRVEEGVAILESAPVPLAPVVSSGAAPVVKGLSTGRKPKYKVVITDKTALLKAIVDGTVPHLAVVADESWLNKQANNLGTLMQYPGVKLEEVLTATFRTK